MKKLVLLLTLLSNLAFAQIPKPLKNTYVNDFAHVLTADEITDLNKKIFVIEKEAGVQLAIVLVKKIPAQYDIQDYTLLIGRKWHVGNKQRGLVYVAAINQRKQRLEVAKGLDSVFNHDKSTDILTAMRTDFAAKNYYGGLQTLVDRLATELVPPQQEPQITKQAVAAPVKEEPTDTFAVVLGIIVFCAMIYGVIRLFTRRVNRYNSGYTGGGYQPGYGGGYRSGYGRRGSGVGSFVAGAALGAAAGYAARSMQNQDYIPQDDNNSTPDDNTPSNWGNWGSDDSSSSSSSYDSSSSSYDSGYSDSDSSSDSGSTTDW